jgi:heptosyltransferase-2
MTAKSPAEILVRGANWIGDAVMTLPALAALHDHFTQARLTLLTRPWAAEVYRGQPGVTQVMTYEPAGRHRGLAGGLSLVRELAHFDLALLFQNAFSAALFPALARIPERWGYARDGRGWLLTRAIRIKPLDLSGHEVFYYLNLLEKLGIPAPYRPPRLHLDESALAEAETLLSPAGLGGGQPILALAPGAAFGPAKRWPETDFAQAARLILKHRPGGTVILGGTEEAPAAARLAEMLPAPKLNLAGRTALSTAMAVLSRASLLLTNDSGLMHLGGALGVPLAAVFGPTDPTATGPLGPSRLIKSRAPCAPCRKRVCPLPRQICFDEVRPALVAEAALELLAGKPAAGQMDKGQAAE